MPETLLDQPLNQRVNHPETVKHRVVSLFSNGLNVKEISDETGVKQTTIRTWINRFKLNHAKATARETLKKRHGGVFAVISSPPKPPAGVSGRLRGLVSRELEAQTALLEQNPPESILELKNTPDREGRASVVKRIAETAALVEDWEAQRAPGVVAIGMMAGPPDEQQAVIDVQAEASEPDPAEEALRALQED